MILAYNELLAIKQKLGFLKVRYRTSERMKDSFDSFCPLPQTKLQFFL